MRSLAHALESLFGSSHHSRSRRRRTFRPMMSWATLGLMYVHLLAIRLGRPGQRFAGILTAILLLPVPAYATLTFGNWFIVSTNLSELTATASANNTTLTF